MYLLLLIGLCVFIIDRSVCVFIVVDRSLCVFIVDRSVCVFIIVDRSVCIYC